MVQERVDMNKTRALQRRQRSEVRELKCDNDCTHSYMATPSLLAPAKGTIDCECVPGRKVRYITWKFDNGTAQGSVAAGINWAVMTYACRVS